MHENVISSYYKNIPDIKTCHDRIGDRIWKREIIVAEVNDAKESKSQGNGMKKGRVPDFVVLTRKFVKISRICGLNHEFEILT